MGDVMLLASLHSTEPMLTITHIVSLGALASVCLRTARLREQTYREACAHAPDSGRASEENVRNIPVLILTIMTVQAPCLRQVD